jgi:hypothetical protein
MILRVILSKQAKLSKSAAFWDCFREVNIYEKHHAHEQVQKSHHHRRLDKNV